MAVSTAHVFAQYVRTKSLFHSVDPVSKLFAVLGISVWAVMINSNLDLFFLFMLLCFTALVLGRIPPRIFIRGARIFVVFGAGLFIMQLLWNHQGTPIYRLWIFSVYSGGLEFGLQKWLMTATFGLASFIYIWTTSPRQAVVGITHMGVPYKYAWGLFLVLRYVPLFENEVKVIREAQAVRGIRRGAGIAGQFEMYKRYIVPLLVSMIRKATLLAIAMDSRAFGAFPDRTFRDNFRWSRSGIALMTLVSVAVVGAIFVYGAPFIAKNPPPPPVSP